MSTPKPISLTQVDAGSYDGRTPEPFVVVGDVPGGGGDAVTWDTLTGKPATFPATVPVASATTATTAGKLTTARSIALTGDVTGTASFDGSANASITAAIGAGVIVNGDVSASAAIAATKVAVAADATNGITAGTLQAALTELAARVEALETP